MRLGQTPATPPPDASKPYVWVGGKWILLARDGDEDHTGMPAKRPVNTRRDSEPGSVNRRLFGGRQRKAR